MVPRLLEPRRTVGRLEHLHPLGLEIDATKQPDRRLVVDHKHSDARCLLYASIRRKSPIAYARGRANTNRDPPPADASTRILPPISCTRPCAMKRPRPVPRPWPSPAL